MRCEAFENRLNEILDERQNPREDNALSAHASKCRRCAGSLSAHDLLLEVLQGTASHRSLEIGDVCEVILRTLDDEPHPRATGVSSGRRPRFRWTWFALAACLCLAFAPLAWRQFQPHQKPGPDDVAHVAPEKRPVDPKSAVPPVVFGPEVADPVAGMARNIGQSMARTGVVAVPGMGIAPAATLAWADSMPLPDDVANGVESLRPLTVPVSAAVTVLRKTIPRVPDRPDPRSSGNVSTVEMGLMV